MKKTVFVIALALVAAAAPATAVDKGFYIGGSLGGSSLDVRDVDDAEELYMLSAGATFTF